MMCANLRTISIFSYIARSAVQYFCLHKAYWNILGGRNSCEVYALKAEYFERTLCTGEFGTADLAIETMFQPPFLQHIRIFLKKCTLCFPRRCLKKTLCRFRIFWHDIRIYSCSWVFRTNIRWNRLYSSTKDGFSITLAFSCREKLFGYL